MGIDRSSLDAKVREGSGKGFARRLRAEKLIPAIVYGRHLQEPLRIAVDPAAVKRAINTPHKMNTLISLKLDKGGEQLVLLKDYQQDPVTRAMLHADFIGVRENEPVKVNVPLSLAGKPEGVAMGGILEAKRRDIEVWAMPDKIPEKIEVDVSHLKIAQALHINDIKLPEGLTVKSHVNYTLAVVTAPQSEAAAPAQAAAAPAAAPAQAAPAAAAKPAAGAAAAKK
ncbi:MAG: 50S ribosomal protein L25/general stress protein Ctc [Myxococcaceae bacterium]|nr:50S ribosomal protein L25/general stress protein Ctc [Myxococcaceae bacterium]